MGTDVAPSQTIWVSSPRSLPVNPSPRSLKQILPKREFQYHSDSRIM